MLAHQRTLPNGLGDPTHVPDVDKSTGRERGPGTDGSAGPHPKAPGRFEDRLVARDLGSGHRIGGARDVGDALGSPRALVVEPALQRPLLHGGGLCGDRWPAPLRDRSHAAPGRTPCWVVRGAHRAPDWWSARGRDERAHGAAAPARLRVGNDPGRRGHLRVPVRVAGCTGDGVQANLPEAGPMDPVGSRYRRRIQGVARTDLDEQPPTNAGSGSLAARPERSSKSHAVLQGWIE